MSASQSSISDQLSDSENLDYSDSENETDAYYSQYTMHGGYHQGGDNNEDDTADDYDDHNDNVHSNNYHPTIEDMDSSTDGVMLGGEDTGDDENNEDIDSDDEGEDGAYFQQMKQGQANREKIMVNSENPTLHSEIASLRQVLAMSSLSNSARRVLEEELESKLVQLSQDPSYSNTPTQTRPEWVPDFTNESFTLDGRVARVSLPYHPLYGHCTLVPMAFGSALNYSEYLDTVLQLIDTHRDPLDSIGFDRLYHIMKVHRIMPHAPRAISMIKKSSPTDNLDNFFVCAPDTGVYLFLRNRFYDLREELWANNETQPSIVFNQECIETMRKYHELVEKTCKSSRGKLGISLEEYKTLIGENEGENESETKDNPEISELNSKNSNNKDNVVNIDENNENSPSSIPEPSLVNTNATSDTKPTSTSENTTPEEVKSDSENSENPEKIENLKNSENNDSDQKTPTSPKNTETSTSQNHDSISETLSGSDVPEKLNNTTSTSTSEPNTNTTELTNTEENPQNNSQNDCDNNDSDSDSESDTEDIDIDPIPFSSAAVASSSFLSADSSINEQHHIINSSRNDPRTAPFFLRAKKQACYLQLPVIFDFPLHVGLEADTVFKIVPDQLIAGRYLVIRQIGEAAFSRAVEVEDIQSNTRFCLKIMHNQKDLIDQCLDEIKVLRLLNFHDPYDMFHIIKMRQAFYHKEHLFLGTELLSCNLHDVSKITNNSSTPTTSSKLSGYHYFNLRNIRKITRQILISLWYLRCFGVLHCDIKPENILLEDWARTRVKLIDFGSSSFLHDNITTYIQSRSYRSPEVILGLPCTLPTALDMWSLGCVLYELYTNNIIFTTRAIPIILAKMQSLLGPIPTDLVQTSRFGPKYFRAVPLTLPPSLSHLSPNALCFQIFQRRIAISTHTRNNNWNKFAPPENETEEEKYSRRVMEETEWSVEDAVHNNIDDHDQNHHTWEESLIDPVPSSLLSNILATATEQHNMCLANKGNPNDLYGLPKDSLFNPLEDLQVAFTCHPTMWPGYKMRPRDWADDNPQRITSFIKRRTVTSKQGIANYKRAHTSGTSYPAKVDTITKFQILHGGTMTDPDFPANPAYPRPQFFGTHHPSNMPAHDSPTLFANFLAQLLKYRPEDRPTPEQALLHPFLWPTHEDEEWDL